MLTSVPYKDLKPKDRRVVAKIWQESTHADRISQAYILWDWRRGGLGLLISRDKLGKIGGDI